MIYKALQHLPVQCLSKNNTILAYKEHLCSQIIRMFILVYGRKLASMTIFFFKIAQICDFVSLQQIFLSIKIRVSLYKIILVPIFETVVDWNGRPR